MQWRCSLLDGPSGLPAPGQICGFSFVLELEALCIALRSGEMLLLNVESRELEEVGCIEGGMLSLEWSPDGEVLAVVSGAGRLLVMTREWEQLAELALAADAAGAAGGSEAEEPQLQAARVVWRGDGKFFGTVCHWSSSRWVLARAAELLKCC